MQVPGEEHSRQFVLLAQRPQARRFIWGAARLTLWLSRARWGRWWEMPGTGMGHITWGLGIHIWTTYVKGDAIGGFKQWSDSGLVFRKAHSGHCVENGLSEEQGLKLGVG